MSQFTRLSIVYCITFLFAGKQNLRAQYNTHLSPNTVTLSTAGCISYTGPNANSCTANPVQAGVAIPFEVRAQYFTGQNGNHVTVSCSAYNDGPPGDAFQFFYADFYSESVVTGSWTPRQGKYDVYCSGQVYMNNAAGGGLYTTTWIVLPTY